MKFKCNREELIKGLNSVLKTVATKTTLPIQEGILIETFNNGIKLTTNDLEIGTEYLLKADVEENGLCVIDMKTFNEIIRKIESEEISFEKQNSIFIIKSTSGIFKLQTMNEEEYKRLPIFSVDKKVDIDQNIFKDMVRKTAFCASVDINRPVYTGVLITISNNVLNLVAIDGFRMAIRKEILENENSEFYAIIPAKVLNEVIKSLEDDENSKISVGINKNQALFEIGPCTVVSRIVEGEFLNYNSVIPAEYDTKIQVNKKFLLEAVDRAAIFSRDASEKDKKVPLKMSINMESVEISCVSVTGDSKEKVNAMVEGKEIEIGFNPRYLIEALKSIEDEEISLNFGSSVSPMVIKPLTGNSYIYMVLPVKLKEE